MRRRREEGLCGVGGGARRWRNPTRGRGGFTFDGRPGGNRHRNRTEAVCTVIFTVVSSSAPVSASRRGSGERGRRARRGGGEGEAVQRPERGDQRVLGRRGVVNAGVAEAAAHEGEHGAGLG
jgi:hypothetical protein